MGNLVSPRKPVRGEQILLRRVNLENGRSFRVEQRMWVHHVEPNAPYIECRDSPPSSPPEPIRDGSRYVFDYLLDEWEACDG